MKNNPNIISKATIYYYRSIDKSILKNIKPVNVITGGNDVGKSNLLRALNLFFNEKDEFGNEFNFQKEFSKNRLSVVQKESVKGQQFIRIDIEFDCRDAFKTTLPDKFIVSKKWTRDSPQPTMTHNLQRLIDTGKLKTTIAKAQGSLSRFLNSIEFHYIPAIKDENLFKTLIAELQQVLSSQAQKKGSSLVEDMHKFNNELQMQASELRTAFHEATGINTNIGLPIDDMSLFKSFEVRTDTSRGDKVGLNQRGDGVRVRFIPEILNYISERSNKSHIWGFEEPENSMEYKKAFELAEKMSTNFSKNSQIFITTHSPAFFNFDNERKNIFLARQSDSITSFKLLDAKEEHAIEEGSYDLMLADELGHVSLMHELNEKLNERIEKYQALEIEQQDISTKLALYEKPVLLTEGITDKIILEHAWSKLRPGLDCPFRIEECDTIGSGGLSAGGAEKLSICLKAVRRTQPHVIIGLFDYDDEGIKRYKLDNTFIAEDMFTECKVSSNGKAYALCLQGCEVAHSKFREFENLSIEFLFPESSLGKVIGGRRLGLRPKPMITRVGNKEVERVESSDLWHMEVHSQKKHFAEKIVPTLNKDDFLHFEHTFKRIEDIVSSL